jgi:hypothetical protein
MPFVERDFRATRGLLMEQLEEDFRATVQNWRQRLEDYSDIGIQLLAKSVSSY